MFTSGQKIFALFFLITFTAVIIWTYRKDLKLHKTHYKNVWVIIVSIFAIIALFILITFSMH